MLPINPPVDASNGGSYPGVFGNTSVDANFGVTSPIYLGQITPTGTMVSTTDLTALTGITTSFSSKSELSLNLSTNGGALTLIGYNAPVGTIDVSNANTPNHIDPTNTDTQTPTNRSVVQVNADGTVQVTNTNAYSGNNGRAAILANNVNGTGQGEYLLVGNAGNGSGNAADQYRQQYRRAADRAGQHGNPETTVVGQQQGTPGAKNGFQYGFSVAQTNPATGMPYGAADKSGKDNNFRGETIFDNTLYVTKGSGGNGIDTVYQVGPPGGGLPTAATAGHDRSPRCPAFRLFWRIPPRPPAIPVRVSALRHLVRQSGHALCRRRRRRRDRRRGQGSECRARKMELQRHSVGARLHVAGRGSASASITRSAIIRRSRPTGCATSPGSSTATAR